MRRRDPGARHGRAGCASDEHGSVATWHAAPWRSRLSSFMRIGDHQLHATQPATSKRAQELDPEGLGFGSSDVHAEDFASAIVVDADRDDDGDRDDAAGLTHLYISGIEPDIRPIAFQRPVEEGLHLVVDLAAQTRYLALGYAGHSHGLHQVIDRARGDALYIGFLDTAVRAFSAIRLGSRKPRN